MARIATGGGATLSSVVSPAGDRLGVSDGTTLNWLVPDLHGNVAGSLEADETDLAKAIRYDAWGDAIGIGCVERIVGSIPLNGLGPAETRL